MRVLSRKKERKSINMLFIFLGAPGSGKGTQSKILEEKFGLLHLSTGDILRNDKEYLGKLTNKYLEKGELVPDNIMIDLVTKNIFSHRNKKIILDGFPRTKEQATSLDHLLEKESIPLEKIVYFFIDKEQLIERLSGRIIDKETGDVYHEKYNPPPENNKNLVRRSDDEPEKINIRLNVYKQMTLPMIEYYREKGNLLEVDANIAAESIHQNLVKKLHLE